MSEDIEYIEKNSNNFKYSIINILNLDTNIIETRINEELFDTYINNILKKELKDKELEDILFNPIIIKLSKNINVYNKYATDITKLNHKEYIDKIKKILNLKKSFNIISKYVKDLEDVDYNNEIENYILLLYAKNILDNKLNNINDQKWFINYIINSNASKQNLLFDVISITNPNIKNIKLFKNKRFKKVIEINNYYNHNIIYINLIIFNVIKNTKGFEEALLYLINSCLKELQKHIQKSYEYSITYDDNMYRFIKENIIYLEDNNFYNKNINYFDTKINLDEKTNNMMNELINNPLFKDFNLKNDNNTNNKLLKNTKNYNLVDNYIDSILIKKHFILKEYPLLQMEYNDNGIRKDIIELINIKKDKLNFYNNQINNYKEILNNDEMDNIKIDIKNKLDLLNNNYNGIVRCHNKMIYKALKSIPISNLSNYCKNLDEDIINEFNEAVLQEKNDFIKKIESNRKKIFKPTTFLENEQFLTKEYSLSARYESKIRDIKKERNSL